MTARRRKISVYRHLSLVLLAVFILVLAGGSILLTSTREKVFQSTLTQAFKTEQGLLTSLLQEPLLRHDYVQLRSMLHSYFLEHPTYTLIQLQAENGFLIFSQQRQAVASRPIKQCQIPLSFDGRSSFTFTLEKVDELPEHWWFKNGTLLLTLFACISGLFTYLMWFIIRRVGLDPLATQVEQERAHYRALFEQAHEAIIVVSQDGTISKMNPAAKKLLNFTDEHTPLDLKNIDSFKVLDQVADFLVKILSKEQYSTTLHMEQSGLYLEIIGSRIINEGEDLFQLLILDVTKQTKYQQQLTTLHEEAINHLRDYQSLFNHSADGLLLRNIDGTLLKANKPYLDMLGYNEDELLGSHCSAVCDNKNCDFLQKILAGKSIYFECNQVCKDGQTVPVEIHSKQISYQGNEVILSCIRDIRDRREKDERLQQLLTVVENSKQGVIVTDARGDILAVNRSLVAICGYSEEELLGENPRLLHSGIQGDEFYLQMWNDLHECGHWQGEIWNKNKQGEYYPGWLDIRAVLDSDNQLNRYVAMFSDLRAQKSWEAKMLHLAQTDPLTGMANRVLFRDRLQQGLKHVQKTKTLAAVLSIGLDYFNKINGSLGHVVGDKVLVETAQRIQKCVHAEDTVSHMSGDEFSVFIYGFKDAAKITALVNTLLQRLREPFVIDGQGLFLTASIGIALFPEDGDSDLTLIQHSDNAMHRAKDQGRDRFCYFSQDFAKQATQALNLEANMRNALAKGEFVLHYQPQVDLNTGEIISAEALLRWNSPERGLVGPNELIPVAEDSGLIIPIGLWVLDTTCKLIADYHHEKQCWLQIAVNVSVKQFLSDCFVDSVLDVVRSHQIPCSCIELEITESLMMTDIEKAITVMHDLHQLGFTLALDDFGTGYTSLAYLKRFPVDKIKLDRTFVTDIHTSTSDAALAQAIIAYARVMGFVVIAEGIEEDVQANCLKEMGFQYGQGYLFSRPLAEHDFLKFLEAGTLV